MRVIVADDVLVTRVGLRTLLVDAGHEVLAEASDAEQAVAAAAMHRPDLAILDIRMPPTFTNEGLRAAAEIRSRLPATAILILSSHVDTDYAAELITAYPEGSGYLLKERMIDEVMLFDAIRRLADGESVVDPSIVAVMMRRRRAGNPLDRLSEREREVLGTIAEGRSNRAIAGLLSITERTVESHTTQIFTKLDLEDDADTHRRVLAVLTLLRGGHTP